MRTNKFLMFLLGVSLAVLINALLGGCTHTTDRRPGLSAPVAQALPVVVEIHTFRNLESTGFGSGVVVDRRGYIVTCWHVLEGDDAFQVGEDFATIIAKDETLDLALIKVDHRFASAATWGDSSTLLPGDGVFVVGYPFDIGELVSTGLISSVSVKLGEAQVLVTDASINPGNSGGGMFDLRGAFIGIPHRFYNPTGASGNIGIGLAIPSNTAHLFVNRNLP